MLLIKDLLSHTREKAVFYFRCDELSDFKELDEVIRDYLKMRDIEGIKKLVHFS
jgi:predicted AAA+ superfamily ATPase